MPEPKRFDPLAWFVSGCFTLLAGAIALVVAVHLLESVWAPLLSIVGSAIIIGGIAALVTAWHRRQPW